MNALLLNVMFFWNLSSVSVASVTEGVCTMMLPPPSSIRCWCAEPVYLVLLQFGDALSLMAFLMVFLKVHLNMAVIQLTCSNL